MSAYNNDTLEHHPHDAVSPTRAYFPPSKTISIHPMHSTALSEKLATTIVSKKAYINLPSIHKVIANHSSKKAEEANAPDYDETIANIPVLDLLPPPPVYDIVNCSTSQTLLLVSSLINTILAVNDRLACPKITLFHSRAIPNISIEAYLSRILQYAPFQNEVLLIILLYFDRIGGGCKPTQVLTNTIPKSLLRQASLTPQEINQLTAPKADNSEDIRRLDEKSNYAQLGQESELDTDNMDEEEPIADEIYTSSSESPVGSKLIINSFNIHRLLITSILVASKFSSDVFYPNVRYARVGGLPLTELNQLELEFLFLSQFELNTTESELQSYGNKLLMYHQRLNGTERASIDAITPAKGEYVRLCEKKHIVHDSKHMPPRIQTSVQPQRRPSSEMEHKPFVSRGPYRDSKEFIDDDENMSEKGDDNTRSPTGWQSGQSTPVVRAETPTSNYPTQRSNKMNLDHMIWPTNETETNYSPTSYYGAMEKDEDAARIEEEFNKASPPPESNEPNPKRKLQRLSSGTLETVPAKRVNNPGKSAGAESKSGLQPGSNNKNILRPLLRKIASFANRSDAPAPEPEPTSQPPALRSHPYLVRHRISPEMSSANTADDDGMASPTSPTSRTMPWQHDEYPGQSQRVSQSFQMKPPPPPYSGENQENEHERYYRGSNSASSYKTSGMSRGRRQHRSREPSLSSLASELTFEPTRPSLSSMQEEMNQDTNHPATLAPFYFPPKPQVIHGPRNPQLDTRSHPLDNDHGYSTPPATPMSRQRSTSDAHSLRDQSIGFTPSTSQSVASPSSESDDSAMQCDEQVISPPSSTSRHFHSEPIAATSALAQEQFRMRASQRIEVERLHDGTSSEQLSSSTRGQKAAESEATAGRNWIPRHTPAPTHPTIQYPHPHYVASYTAPNTQLLQSPMTATMLAPQPGVAVASRNPQALSSTSVSSSSKSSKQPTTPITPRPGRQFAPIRPRTPMTTEEESKGHAAQTTTETSSSAQKKKKMSSSEGKSHQQPQPLRPLVPAVVAAPPPYRPPFIAYPSPFGHQLCAPDGSPIRPPTPMIMAVDYSRGAITAAGHAPQFIAAAPQGPGSHPGAPRLYIPVIPVMYNKPPPQIAPSSPSPISKAPSKTNTPAKIAPRLNRTS
ncbi:hypothetical protein BGZ49_005146 [Haplosporangium sp. Z 27]|nr:hypothetical protein BGZ49_005146 [Haplosporangium sp. Z 27]